MSHRLPLVQLIVRHVAFPSSCSGDAQGGILIPRFDARGNPAARGDFDFQGAGSGGTGSTLTVMA